MWSQFCFFQYVKRFGNAKEFGNSRKDGRCSAVCLPLDCVAIVTRKLVMEVVVPFAQGHQRGDDVVARAIAVTVEEKDVSMTP